MCPKFTDVVVAVHGIGQQSRNSTIRSVATRLAHLKTLLGGSGNDSARPVAPQPLGYFHCKPGDFTKVCLLDDAAFLGKTPLASIGFAEVFWADIPEKVVDEGSTLEETKAWARTVVARAQALWLRERGSKQGGAGSEKETNASRRLIPPDFGLAAEVLDEIIETVYVLQNLMFLADKAALFKFDLAKVLQDYLGDVQIVTEFADYCTDIVARFHQAMQNIYAEECRKGNVNVRLHVVAHSEGTVVSFLGLLQALAGYQLKKQNDALMLEKTDQIPEWLKHVHGFMTIGSPIDKHLLLWPRLWNEPNSATPLDLSLGDKFLSPGQIRWRNYYDYGDPIGFKLDTARRWLDQRGCKAFEFCNCKEHGHDMGFARYLLPGKAHNDYWNDPAVFEHFVEDVIASDTTRPSNATKPTSKVAVSMLSPTLPYLISAIVLVIGVYLLCKAVTQFTFPDDPLTKYFLITAIGVEPTPGLSNWDLFRNVLGFAGLTAGMTLLARFPRLAAGPRWKGLGAAAFGIGCLLYTGLVLKSSRLELGAAFTWIIDNAGIENPFTKTATATAGVCLLALAVGVLGYFGMRPGKHRDEDRRQRWFFKGMRPLIITGAVAVALMVIFQLFPQKFGLSAQLTPAEIKQLSQVSNDKLEVIKTAGFDRQELDQLFKANPEHLERRIARVKPFLTARPPVWPVLLAGMGFLYLWWLATLIFDLAFVWHRYVRHSIVNYRLSQWAPDGLADISKKVNQPEECRLRQS